MLQSTGHYPAVHRLLSRLNTKDLSPLAKRLTAQLTFAGTLSDASGGAYDTLIDRAADAAIAAIDAQGALTRDAVEAAEKILAPLCEEAKSYNFLCVGHAHIDMNWQWAYDETVGVTLDTFNTILRLMQEYPDIKFSQSQASVYRIVEEHAPWMLPEIRALIAAGRWEVTAATWVEADRNMSGAESQSRHYLYTKRYLQNLLGVDPESLDLDFVPVTFGHSAMVPELLTNAGIKYYYHCRGQVGEQYLYRWEAPSGTQVLLYTDPFWYQGLVDETIGSYAVELARVTGTRTMLKMYGVGDHGGGPTRRDIERLIEMNTWPVFPSFTFSRLRDFFQTVAPLAGSRPVVRGEMNTIFDGCFTSQSRIKEGNRKSEEALYTAEALSVLAGIRSRAIPSPDAAAIGAIPDAAFEDAWRKVLFNQFHDILPGSGLIETREYALSEYQKAYATAESQKRRVFRVICDNIDTEALLPVPECPGESIAEGGGAGTPAYAYTAGRARGFVLFNADTADRRQVTELTLWDYEGDLDCLRVRDNRGNPVTHQLLKRDGDYWIHKYATLLIDAEIPALGYRFFIVDECPEKKPVLENRNTLRLQIPEEFILENDLVRVTLDTADGSVASFIDKVSGNELIAQGKRGAFRFIREDCAIGATGYRNEMSSWIVGRYRAVSSAHEAVTLKRIECGPLRDAIEMTCAFGASEMTVTYALAKDSARLVVRAACDWREFGTVTETPSLQYYLPHSYACDTYLCDIPFGTVTRPAQDIDVPAVSFAAALNPAGSLRLSARTKYGFRCTGDALILSMIRASVSPDPTPETGMHVIEFSLDAVPASRDNAGFIADAADCARPFTVAPVARHAGVLAAQDSVLSVDGAAVSSIKFAEDGSGIVVRLYETDGKRGTATLRCGFTPQGAALLTVTEKPADGKASLDADVVNVEMAPYAIRTVLINL